MLLPMDGWPHGGMAGLAAINQECEHCLPIFTIVCEQNIQHNNRCLCINYMHFYKKSLTAPLWTFHSNLI